MASDHLKATLKGLIQTIEEDSGIQTSLVKVFPYFAQFSPGYRVEQRMITIQITVGDSGSEEPLHNETTGTDILSTEFILVCDTKLPRDSEIFISDDGETLLDLEYKVLRSLQSATWWNASTHHYGWSVGSITRDVPILDENGEQDYDSRRFIILLDVDISFDRDDGPAR